jgi:RNA polymerase sigma factor (sigma-70 family)
MAGITPEILSELLDRHGPALVLYAQQRCDVPEDVVQEAVLQLVRQAALPDDPAAWLYRVVRNLALNASRSQQRRVRRETAAGADRPQWFTASDDDRLDASEAALALGELPVEQRETIVARLWGGLSFEEIARLSGSSTSSVHRWYQKGLETLRERLGATWRKNETKAST